MSTAVDTNIFLDVLGNDPTFGEASARLLEEESERGMLIISPIVYAELLVFFLRKHQRDDAVSKLKEFLDNLDVRLVNLDERDLALAAEAWQRFAKGSEVRCPRCGKENRFMCNACGSRVSWRNHLIPDFLIGSHAQNHANRLATRDKGYYKRYFMVNLC